MFLYTQKNSVALCHFMAPNFFKSVKYFCLETSLFDTKSGVFALLCVTTKNNIKE
jgi:hypothetical protein